MVWPAAKEYVVEAFNEMVMDTLKSMGLETRIWPMPADTQPDPPG